MHLDLNYSRSWFQTPNAYDNLNVQNVVSGGTSANPTFGNVGNTDQRSKIGTYNISPTYTRIISNNSVFNLGAFVRRDDYDYYPSGNPLADLGPSNLQTSIHLPVPHADQRRRSMRTTPTSKGINNIKIGAQYEQTFLRENDNLGVVDATLQLALRRRRTAIRCRVTPTHPQCAGAAIVGQSRTICPVLAPYDLTRGGGFYNYFGHTDVKELALYIEDQIKAGNWNFNLGIREDLYNGLTDANQTEPRLGVAYNIKPTSTVLSVSYARTLETPFNENLVLSSSGCSNAVLTPLLACSPGVSGTLAPGYRNEFHASLQQAFGKNAGLQRRVHLEVHPQRLRLQRAGQYAHHLPHRLAQLQDSRLCAARRGPELPRLQRLLRHVVGGGALLPAAVGRRRSGARPGRVSVPHRPRRKVQPDHPRPVHVPGKTSWPMGGFNWRYDSGLVAGRCPATTSPTPTAYAIPTTEALPSLCPMASRESISAASLPISSSRRASPAMA